MDTKKVYATIFSFLLMGNLSYAQINQVSEADINLQKIYIEATREKLLGNYENAVVLLKEILKEDKNNAAVAFELGRTYDLLDDHEKAVKSVKLATLLDTDNVWYQLYLADVYQKMGNDKSAAGIYEELVKTDPNNESYYLSWAYFLVRSNDIQKAIKVYNELEAVTGINEETIRRKHALYLGLGDNKKAAKELQSLINAFPDNVEYLHLLAGFYEQVGDKNNVLKTYQKILQLDPDDSRAIVAITASQTQSNTGGFAALSNLFARQDIDIDSKIKELMPYLQQVVDNQDTTLADELLNLTAVLEKAHPKEAKVYAIEGDLLYHSERPDQALERYKRTLELDDSVYSVWEQVLYIYHDEADYDNLLKYSENALDVFPNQATAHYFSGVAYKHKQAYEDALDALEQALLMSGRNGLLKVDILNELGAVYHYLKKYEDAVEAFEEALELNPDAPSVLSRYSYYLAEQEKELEQAKQMGHKANQLVPNVPEYENNLGWVYYKVKDFQQAKEWIGKAVEKQPTHPQTLERYGDVLYQLEETERAISYWQKALENGAKNTDLLEKKIAEKKLFE